MNNTNSWIGRKMKALVVSLFLFLGMIAFTGTAQSKDDYKYSFLFTVPVQVQKLSDKAKVVRLNCGVKDANGDFIAEDFSGSNYGKNEVIIDSTGGFSGTLTYALKLKYPTEASKAKTYECDIQPGDNHSYQNFADCNSGIYFFFCLKPGTPRTLKIQGTIP
jgi:hypothetical protein